jgi:hypothetical protein
MMRAVVIMALPLSAFANQGAAQLEDYAHLIENITRNQTTSYCRDCPVGNTTTEGCCPGEEAYLGLCFKACSSFNNGTHPHRVAPNVCCNKDDVAKCIFESNHTIKDDFPGPWGYGTDIAGEAAKTACFPSDSCRCDIMTTEGCCPDEENWWGLCYKKCNTLTNGTHPNRCWPNACSITGEFTTCFDPANLKWSGFGPTGYGVDRDGSFAKIQCYTATLISIATTTRLMWSMTMSFIGLAIFL